MKKLFLLLCMIGTVWGVSQTISAADRNFIDLDQDGYCDRSTNSVYLAPANISQDTDPTCPRCTNCDLQQTRSHDAIRNRYRNNY